MPNRSGGVIEATSEPLNWIPPFAVPVKRPFWGPTPEGEKWLAEHPEEAKKAEGYVPTTLIPFSPATISRMKTEYGYEAPKDEPMQTVTNSTPARHMDTKQGYPPSDEVNVDHIISVGWWWDNAHGRHDGYSLYLSTGGAPQVFPEHEYRIVEALPVPLTEGQQSRVPVGWRVEWSHKQGIISITDWQEDEAVESIKETSTQALKNAAERKKAKAAADAKDGAPRSESEWETFDKPAPNQHWIKDEPTKRHFWAQVHSAFNKWQAPQKGREEFAHSVLGVVHTEEYTGTEDEALALIRAEVDKVYGKPEEKPAVSELPQVKVQDAPPTNEKATPQSEPLPAGVVASELPEAPFSANFFLYHKKGVHVQFTVRTDTVSEGIRRVDMTIDHLMANGYTVDKPGQVTATSAPTVSVPSVPQTGVPTVPQSNGAAQDSGGIVRCVEVKKVQDEGETHYLLFGLPNDDKPEFTARVDADHKKLLATGLAIEQLTIGTRYPWPVDVEWEPSKKINPKNNKPYRNIKTIRKVA